MQPPIADDDDPMSQIAWPRASGREDQLQEGSPGPQTQLLDEIVEPVSNGHKKRRMTTWNLMTLSLGMLGAQVAWTVELGYGTPILLQLGLSEQATAIVWLAGPISGLICQPLIGAISDSSPSRYRRRYWIILSTLVLVASTFVLAYCEVLARFFVDLFQVGQGDWDEARNMMAAKTAIVFAIISFWLLDFALNGLQASLRNLLLDIAPSAQLSAGNAWHSRMTNAGNIVGYAFGFLPLTRLPFLRRLGGNQFRRFCLIAILILVVTVWTTCYLHEEESRPNGSTKRHSKLREIIRNIYTAVVNLPRSIRRVCYVQLAAFMGWFPFLFYATTYMGQIMAFELDREPDHEIATRKGELAMLLYSIVATVAGFLLPFLTNRDKRLLSQKGDVNQGAELSRIRKMVREWKIEAARHGRPLRLPYMPVPLRSIWSASLLLFTVLTWCTFFVVNTTGATVIISLIGISWSVAMWAPFAIMMELLKELPLTASSQQQLHGRTAPSLGVERSSLNERQPLLRRESLNLYGESLDEEEAEEASLAGGTILGIHNLSIVMPQFVIAIVSSIIFQVVDGNTDAKDPTKPDTYYGNNGVAWILRFGGACTIIGALLACRVPLTPAEKAMRRRLAEMKASCEEPQS